jgi:hypothetical protein
MFLDFVHRLNVSKRRRVSETEYVCVLRQNEGGTYLAGYLD